MIFLQFGMVILTYYIVYQLIHSEKTGSETYIVSFIATIGVVFSFPIVGIVGSIIAVLMMIGKHNKKKKGSDE